MTGQGNDIKSWIEETILILFLSLSSFVWFFFYFFFELTFIEIRVKPTFLYSTTLDRTIQSP